MRTHKKYIKILFFFYDARTFLVYVLKVVSKWHMYNTCTPKL